MKIKNTPTLRQFNHIFLPCFSMMILTLGNSFLTTTSSIDLKEMALSNWLVGFITTGYFLGIVIGAFYAKKLIMRIGYIRGYATFAAITACAALLQGMVTDPGLWFFSRLLTGYAISGLFVVIESWILSSCSPEFKGRMLAFYLLIYYMAQASGQLLLNFHIGNMLLPYCIIAFLSIVSILPVAITKLEAPATKIYHSLSFFTILKQAKLGLLVGMFSGIILSAIYAIYPLFLHNSGLDASSIAWLMFATILGGAALQYPIGKLTDLFDRRIVLCGICGLLLVNMTLAFHFDSSGLIWLLIMSFLMGGLTFTMYPISITLTTDRIDGNNTISALSALTVCYGVGSLIGPTLFASNMHLFNQRGFFVLLAGITLILLGYLIFRIIVKMPVNPDEKTGFMPGAPIVANMLESEEIQAQKLGKE